MIAGLRNTYGERFLCNRNASFLLILFNRVFDAMIQSQQCDDECVSLARDAILFPFRCCDEKLFFEGTLSAKIDRVMHSIVIIELEVAKKILLNIMPVP